MRYLLVLFFLVQSAFQAQAQAQCIPGSGYGILDVNNVSARLNMGQSNFWNLIGTPHYEIPKGSGKNSLFTQSLWLAGTDQFGQEHCAAVRFHQVGFEYWPGPISPDGSIDPYDCADHDRIYKLNRWEVEEFRQRYDVAGYVIPSDILEWPATGNPHAQADAGAPFVDVNEDGIYNAMDGDYPAFALDGEQEDRDHHLLGDQCLWWVENDVGGPHTETGGQALGVELRCMAYAYRTCDELNDQTFYRYKLTNRSEYDYTDTYMAVWVDADVGFAQDDYVQCDVMRHLGFAYNGMPVDGTGGPHHYGANPPAVGVAMLQGALADPGDMVDNDRDGQMDEPGERLMMSKFIYHNNTGEGNPNTQDPVNCSDYYNYMRGIWRDGSPLCYGGTGYSPGSCDTPADFMFPADSDPLGYGTGGMPTPLWTEGTSGNQPFDRRFMLSSGPFSFDAEDEEVIHYAVVWGRDMDDPEISASIQRLKDVTDTVRTRFEEGFSQRPCCPPDVRIGYQQHSTFKFLFSSMAEGDSFEWDFGDGSTWSGRFPLQHTYADYGEYEVCLTVENDCGTVTACTTVVISPPPIGVRLQRIEGQGNMGRELQFWQNVEDSVFTNAEPRVYHPWYDFNKGPVRVEVIDSTLLPALQMYLALDGVSDSAGWKMYPVGGADTVYSASTIGVGDAQLIPQWGLLVQVKQVDQDDSGCMILSQSSIEQSSDPWLKWLQDTDYPDATNWIRAGSASGFANFGDYNGDPNECFETMLDGTWAPWRYTSHTDSMSAPSWEKFKHFNKIGNLHSVDIVITPDQNKWTRCAVLEVADEHVPSIGNARRFDLRQSPSVNKDGNPDGSGTIGMGWFPGYAISLETGERLNMAFGENSWLANENGADMVWNPTSTEMSPSGEPVFGGGHYIYVFGHNGDSQNSDVPMYDEGSHIQSRLSSSNYAPDNIEKRGVYKDVMWVGVPMLESGHQLLESEVRIRLRVRRPYRRYLCLDEVLNDTLPLYRFNTVALGTDVDEQAEGAALTLYPNPTADVVNIHNGSENTLDRVTIYATDGKAYLDRTVSLAPRSVLRLSVSDFPSGLYYVIVRAKNGSARVKKLMVR